jgi:hypothetical protein
MTKAEMEDRYELLRTAALDLLAAMNLGIDATAAQVAKLPIPAQDRYAELMSLLSEKPKMRTMPYFPKGGG